MCYTNYDNVGKPVVEPLIITNNGRSYFFNIFVLRKGCQPCFL
jgi:hypothetical protein